MRARSPHEPHRTATPLELLFDLVFVVAISEAAQGLHHALGSGHVTDGLLGYRFEGQRYDAGDKVGYVKANVAYALKRPELRESLLAYLREVVS